MARSLSPARAQVGSDDDVASRPRPKRKPCRHGLRARSFPFGPVRPTPAPGAPVRARRYCLPGFALLPASDFGRLRPGSPRSLGPGAAQLRYWAAHAISAKMSAAPNTSATTAMGSSIQRRSHAAIAPRSTRGQEGLTPPPEGPSRPADHRSTGPPRPRSPTALRPGPGAAHPVESPDARQPTVIVAPRRPRPGAAATRGRPRPPFVSGVCSNPGTP